MPIFPPLSRASKSRPYLPDETSTSRKRKRPQGQHSFEVRPSKNGVGMFATQHISCGDIIIANEEPIVHCGSFSYDKPKVCDVCSTPIGTLRKTHLLIPSKTKDIILPYLDGDQDLEFTKQDITSQCKQCEKVAWCSEECHESRRLQHEILCGSASLKDFYSAQENPNIFQLTTKSITLILSHYLTSFGRKDKDPIEQFYWWKDYGSHPLWWEVGSSRENKKDLAIEFGIILEKALLEAVGQKRVKIDDAVIRQLCSLKNIGSILGMLQCNVMEYEYPSPTQQYMEHVQDILEEVAGEDDPGDISVTSTTDCDRVGVEEDSHMIALKNGCQWLSKNIANYTDGPAMQPIVGSGLYSLLTLANHDCNPNASIEFLQESNRGSMIATRDIPTGEEICITYVPNGGVGSGDGSSYFRHFLPTQTWKWLASNDQDDDESDANSNKYYDDEEASASDHMLKDDADYCSDASEDKVNDEQRSSGNIDQPLEGSDKMERAKTLLEYGFECQCSRCGLGEKEA